MDSQQIFDVTNSAALAAWIVLLLAPLRRGPIVLAARVMAVGLAATYTVLIAISLSGSGGLPDFSSPQGIAAAFADPAVMTVAWIHYLAFDLLVGTWEVEEAGRRGIPHLLVVPCLALTFLFGPVGFLLFIALRAFWARRAPATA